MHKAILYEKLPNKKVKCICCRHYCVISDGKRGICKVRQNVKGELFLLTYGKAAAYHIDAIEKKPLYHFLPGSNILSLGTLGCSFKCLNCQNWEISQVNKINPELYGLELTPEDVVNTAIKKKIPSIAYTYSEPTVAMEYCYDIAKLAHEKKIKNVFVSNGYLSDESLKLIKNYLDGINIDLKSFNENFYKKNCGAKLEGVLETIKKIKKLGIWLEITTLVIPGKNDSDEELSNIAEFISEIDKNIPWHVSAFHPMYKMLKVERTSHESLVKAYNIGKKYLNYVYVGNVNDDQHSNTYCPKCNEILIRRHGYDAIIENLKNGKCAKCGEKIKGVWK